MMRFGDKPSEKSAGYEEPAEGDGDESMASLSSMAGKKAGGKLRAALDSGDDAAIYAAVKSIVTACMAEGE